MTPRSGPGLGLLPARAIRAAAAARPAELARWS